jgi:hypothetical protein
VRGLDFNLLKLFRLDGDIGVGIDLVALDDILGLDLIARIGVHFHISDAMPGLSVDLVEADLFGIGGDGNRATGQVTSERRRKPFQLARGTLDTPGLDATELGFKRSMPDWFPARLCADHRKARLRKDRRRAK